jgi:predicted TPR repeat methyltransferase
MRGYQYMKRIIYFLLISSSYADSPEALYRKTVNSWRSRRNWKIWKSFNDEIISMFEMKNTVSGKKLEIIGAMEEGILVIEKATVAMGEGFDAKRDGALSVLYGGYGKMLSQLSEEECHNLALDPHTLLIGAETVSRGDKPSTFLCIENAENALRNAVTLDATNANAEALLEKVTGESSSVHERKPKEFVAELFDSFADSFDEKLNNLEYKVPQIVGDKVRKLERKYKAVLDAGCGTGLAGRFVRPFITEIMVGVDASQKMLDIAAKCTFDAGCGIDAVKEGINSPSPPLYESLLQLDLEDMTVQNTLGNYASKDLPGFDLVIAADVFVYFGSLENVLHSFANISIEGANLVFSCERATSEEAPLGWRLLSSGRFAHTKEHVVNAASDAGYSLVAYEEIIPRMERGEEVQGHLFTFVMNNRIQEEL